MPVTVYTIWTGPVKRDIASSEIAQQAADEGLRVTAVTVAE